MTKRPKQNSDHAQQHNTPTIENEAIANQLKALLTPAIANQQKYYKQLGLRDRILNLSFKKDLGVPQLLRKRYISIFEYG